MAAYRVLSNGRKDRGSGSSPPNPQSSYVDYPGVISINGSASNQIIEGFRFTGSGFSDNRIALKFEDCTGDIIVRKCKIQGFTGLDSRAIYVKNCKRVLIELNDYYLNTTNCQIWNSQFFKNNQEYFVYDRNKSLDIYGNRNDGSYGGLTSDLQMVNVTSDNIVVTNNRNQFVDGKPHDIYNFLKVVCTPTGRGRFENNWARGTTTSRTADGVWTSDNCGNPWGDGGAFCVWEQGSTYWDATNNICVHVPMYGFQAVRNGGPTSNIRLYDNKVILEKRSEYVVNRRTGIITLCQTSLSYQVEDGVVEDMERNVGITYRWRDELPNPYWVRNDVYPGAPGVSDKTSNKYGAAAEAAGYNPNIIPDYII
ncbi:MAG: hypothetical protein NW226_17470 [Microscillaceae bacterium]|nr:hypothetical protein [Microscillaceae bacterium]